MDSEAGFRISDFWVSFKLKVELQVACLRSEISDLRFQIISDLRFQIVSDSPGFKA